MLTAAQVEEVRRDIERRRVADAVAGVAVGLVDRDATHLWLCGSRSAVGDKPVDDATMFSLQSISKPFTALVACLAADEGAVALDEPITTYLPDFAVMSRFAPGLERGITLRHLLSHKAGLTHEAPGSGNYGNAGDVEFHDHLRAIRRSWLRYPPGQRYAYSNLGFDLAVEVLEVVYREPIEDIFQRLLAGPLRLTRTTYDSDTALADANRAVGFDPRVPSPAQRLPMVGAGGVHSTAADLCTLLRVIVNDGLDDQRVLPAGLLSSLAEVPWPVPGQEFGYGLGLVTFRHNGVVLHGHSGGGCGFLCDLYWSPEHGVGAFMLSNHSQHSFQNSLVTDLITNAAPSHDNMPDRDDVEPQRSDLRRFLGSYVGREFAVELVEDDGEFAASIGGIRLPLTPTSASEAKVELGSQIVAVRFIDECSPTAAVLLSDGSWFDRVEPTSAVEVDELRGHAGSYEIRVQGKPVDVSALLVDGSTPRLDWPFPKATLALTRHAARIWFSTTGEVLDLTTDPPTYANIPLFRSSGEPHNTSAAGAC